METLPLGLDPGKYWLIVIAASIACLAGFYFAFYFWKRVRIIEDAPTAKVRSAHQGYVELEGEGCLMDGEPILAPLTHHKCVWFRYKIERKDSSYSNRRQDKWRTIKQVTSDNLFQLVDETGACLIDPEGAEVSSDEKTVWYGSSEWPVSAPALSGSSSFSVGIERYRYTEWLILPRQSLYVIGEFKTVTATANYSMKDVTRDLIRNWKQNQADLLQRFDTNKDGKIDQEEWQLVRQSAKLHAQAEYRELQKKAAVHIVSKPDNRQQPFMLSVYPQAQLTKRLRWYAYGSLAGFFVAGSASVWLLQAVF